MDCKKSGDRLDVFLLVFIDWFIFTVFGGDRLSAFGFWEGTILVGGQETYEITGPFSLKLKLLNMNHLFQELLGNQYHTRNRDVELNINRAVLSIVN